MASSCPNGPDEYGGYPCDPVVDPGGKTATCQTCGWVGGWPQSFLVSGETLPADMHGELYEAYFDPSVESISDPGQGEPK